MRGAVFRLVLLVLVAAVATTAWVIWFRGEEESAPPSSALRLYAVDQDQIGTVTVETDQGRAAFARRQEGWFFAAEPLLPVNLDRWGGIVLLLTGPEIDRVLPEPENLSSYGLDAPSTVSVGLGNGDRVTVRLGANTPDGRHYYAQVDGQSGVAIVNAPWGDALARLVSEPPRPYWFYRTDPTLVRVFEVENADGAATFLLGLSSVDGKPSARVVVGDTARDLGGAEREELMGIMGGPNTLQLLPWPSDQSLDDLGLASPDVFIRLSYELPTPLENRSVFSTVYAIGVQVPGGDGYYVLTDDAPSLLAFDAAWVEEAMDLAGRRLPR